jgi:hypothetical protein
MKRVPSTGGSNNPSRRDKADLQSAERTLARRTGRHRDVPPWPSDTDIRREMFWRNAFGNDPTDRGTIGKVEDLASAAERMLRVLEEDRDSFTVQATRVGLRQRLTDLLADMHRVLTEIRTPGLTMPTDVERQIGLLAAQGHSDVEISEKLRGENGSVDAVRKARKRLPRGAYLGYVDGKPVFHEPLPRRRGRPRKPEKGAME